MLVRGIFLKSHLISLAAAYNVEIQSKGSVI